jgi:hypothetical protein
LRDVIRFDTYSKNDADAHIYMRQNRFVQTLMSGENGGVYGDMVVVEKKLTWAKTDLVGESERILLGTPSPVLDLTGIIKGVIALEDLVLYDMEKDAGRSTTKIDLGIDLYDMEDWD